MAAQIEFDDSSSSSSSVQKQLRAKKSECKPMVKFDCSKPIADKDELKMDYFSSSTSSTKTVYGHEGNAPGYGVVQKPIVGSLDDIKMKKIRIDLLLRSLNKQMESLTESVGIWVDNAMEDEKCKDSKNMRITRLEQENNDLRNTNSTLQTVIENQHENIRMLLEEVDRRKGREKRLFQQIAYYKNKVRKKQDQTQ